MNHVRVGSRVWYKEGGDTTDIGTVVDIVLDDEGPFIVKWDRQYPSEENIVMFPPPEVAKALGVKPQAISTNKADNNIDGFKASQLGLIKY